MVTILQVVLNINHDLKKALFAQLYSDLLVVTNKSYLKAFSIKEGLLFTGRHISLKQWFSTGLSRHNSVPQNFFDPYFYPSSVEDEEILVAISKIKLLGLILKYGVSVPLNFFDV
jgi:hypothetical protein